MSTSPKRFPSRAKRAKHTPASSRRKWSQDVTEHSDAMTLEPYVFQKRDPDQIATSLKRSAQKSTRRKSGAFRSAMSMLTFYVNRAGRNLSEARRRVLDAAKDKLREKFGRPAPAKS